MTSDDVRMRGFASRVSFDRALEVLAGRVKPLPERAAPLAELRGAVLAAAVISPSDVPRFRRSAMDGYAVRAADSAGATEHSPALLELVGVQLAGESAPRAIKPGEALRIMTGGAVPDGADAVVMAEYAREADSSRVLLYATVSPGTHVMPVGEDVRAGTCVLRTGRRLRPQDVALLAAIGVHTAIVRPRPRVVILPTGNELVPPGTTPGGTSVVDSNSTLLTGLAALHGADAMAHAIVPDDVDALRQALVMGARDADLVVVIGGTSVGSEDHVPVLVRELGDLPVHGISMKPAGPTGIGFIAPAAIGTPGRERPVILAPGSPVAAMIAFDFFAGAAICLLQGRAPMLPYPKQRGRLVRKVTSVPGRTDLVRVSLDRDGGVTPLMTGGASILTSTTRADGLLIVPDEREGFAAGTGVEVLRFDSESVI